MNKVKSGRIDNKRLFFSPLENLWELGFVRTSANERSKIEIFLSLLFPPKILSVETTVSTDSTNSDRVRRKIQIIPEFQEMTGLF
jgi:ABC-type uncharacterized transport system ATPase subunit